MQVQAYEKACSKCGAVRPLTEYYVKREHGRERWYSHCKACHGKVCRRWEAANRDEVRERSRRYDAGPAGDRRRAHIAAWNARHPEIGKAHSAVHRALAAGLLVRPDRCDECGEDPGRAHDGRSLVEAHHADYFQPLDVSWLCSSCHKHEHRKE